MKIHWPGSRLACLTILSSAALATVWAGTGAPPASSVSVPAAASAAISAVRIAQSGHETTVRVEAGSTLTFHQMRLANPPRVVLDFSNARLETSNHPVASTFDPVRGIRLGQSDADDVRLVIDLEHFAADRVQSDASGVTITFSAEAAPAATTGTAVVPAALTGIPQMSLPAWLTTENSALAAPTDAPPAPAQQPAPQSAQTQSSTRQEARNFAVVEATPQPVVETSAQATATASSDSGTKKYTGEPISVNLKDVDLKDFFRLIHEISGLNVVLDPNVHGTLTIVLDDVPWDQALDIVLKNNDLARELEGNVLRVATVDTLKKEADGRRAQVESEALAVEKVSVTRFLSYAHAKDVILTVKKFLSARGDVVADERTNAVIVNDIPKVIPIIDRLLTQLDRKTQEVEIEARVVAATRQFARDIGTQLGFGWGNGHSAIGGASAVGSSPTTVSNLTPGYITVPGTGTTTGNSIPLFSNLGSTAPTSGLTFLNASNTVRIDAVLSMAESRGLLKVLSRPRVVTQNNIQAVVKQGVRVPIVTQAQLGGPPTVTYVDAFLRLTVVPQITSENTIFLNVDVENTTPNFAQEVQGNPELITQQATTQVLVTDGGTVVIGGVIQTQNSINVNQVPLLGNIPILGNLFKHVQVSTSNQELIFFITPRIIQT